MNIASVKTSEEASMGRVIRDAVRKGERCQVFILDFVQDKGDGFVLRQKVCLIYVLKYHSSCCGLFHYPCLRPSETVWPVSIEVKNTCLSSFE